MPFTSTLPAKLGLTHRATRATAASAGSMRRIIGDLRYWGSRKLPRGYPLVRGFATTSAAYARGLCAQANYASVRTIHDDGARSAEVRRRRQTSEARSPIGLRLVILCIRVMIQVRRSCPCPDPCTRFHTCTFWYGGTCPPHKSLFRLR